MSSRIDRIATTHVGSLPRSQAVTDVLFGREGDAPRDTTRDDAVIAAAVNEVVRRQVVRHRFRQRWRDEQDQLCHLHRRALSGFAGDSPRQPGQDLVEFPGLLRKLAERGSTASYRRPRCVGPVAVKDPGRCGPTSPT